MRRCVPAASALPLTGTVDAYRPPAVTGRLAPFRYQSSASRVPLPKFRYQRFVNKFSGKNGAASGIGDLLAPFGSARSFELTVENGNELSENPKRSVDLGLNSGGYSHFVVFSGGAVFSTTGFYARNSTVAATPLVLFGSSALLAEESTSSQLYRKGLAIERTERNQPTTRINTQIRISPIRVIGPDGAQLGIISTDEAMNRARDAGLDLVEVAPNEKPPVCRIMDFGKYKYEKNKKKHSSAHAHQTKTKEIRLRPKTGEHDIDTKVRQARGFLQHKDKVQISVLFRGREMAHIEEGRKVMEAVIAELSEHGKVESTPQQNGRRMIATMAPK